MTTAATEVKERPVIFSGPMVKAIIEGRKSQTRRVVKPQPLSHERVFKFWDSYFVSDIDDPRTSNTRNDKTGSFGLFGCPYGMPGDRLWCRETFSYIPKAKNEWHDKVSPDGCPVEMLYRAEYPDADDMQFPMNWTPSIFMPRWASRITLEVVSVRVERLQGISEADAIAEGVYTNEQALQKLGLPADTKLQGTCVDKYRIVWESLNGKKYPWASNPWVWVVEFKKI
jgi:hypothetical protein